MQNEMPSQPVEVFFATNRENLGTDARPELGKRFHPNGPQYIRYGRATVRAPKEWSSDKFEFISARLAKENMRPRTGERILGSAEVFESLRERMVSQESDTLIYIHGFANSFESAMERAAELKVRYQFDSDRPLNVFAFSWPSDGEMIPLLSYYRDRDDARMSGYAMARSLLSLRRWIDQINEENKAGGRPLCRQRLHLVAHSMGNYAFRNAIQSAIAQIEGRPERIFDNVFLMAADEDDDTFERDYKLAALPDLTRAVHVYFSKSDVPLDELSDITKMMPDRLGTDGPKNKDGLHRKVVLVDCTDVDWTGNIAHAWHQYYRLRPEVYEDVRQVLRGISPIDIEGRRFLPDERAYQILPFDKR